MDAQTEVIVQLFRDTARRLGIEGSYLTGEARFATKQIDVLMRDLCDREVLAPLDPDALERALLILRTGRDSGETRGKR